MRATASYVTGSHAFKVGFQDMMGWLRQATGDYKAGLWACVVVPLIAALSMALLSKSFTRKS